jgi:hypothetical protein
MGKKRRRISEPTAQVGRHIIAPEASDDVPPRWCFAHVVDGDYNPRHLDKNQKALLLDQLLRRSQLTWKQIKLTPREGLGFEAIAGKSLKSPIPPVAEGEIILCFRMGENGGRFLGIRKHHTFHILWVDCVYELYDH